MTPLAGQIAALADLLATAERAWVLTGAGMSTESGLADFRGERGLWKQRRVEELANIEALRTEPAAFWEFYRMRIDALDGAVPNAAHRALAELESHGVIDLVATQNVDGLQQQAGTRSVIELHGSLQQARCRSCGHCCSMDEARRAWTDDGAGIPHCRCGSVLGPGVVLFGEPLPLTVETAFEHARGADVVLALGTSLEVFPAAHLPIVTLERGGRLGIVNRGTTGFDSVAHVKIDAQLGAVLPEVARILVG